MKINLKGKIKERYPELKGKDWINQLDPEDRQVVLHALQANGDYGKLGGQARAQNGKRDESGRFAKGSKR